MWRTELLNGRNIIKHHEFIFDSFPLMILHIPQHRNTRGRWIIQQSEWVQLGFWEILFFFFPQEKAVDAADGEILRYPWGSAAAAAIAAKSEVRLGAAANTQTLNI